jgi:hypothetical protein
VVTKRFFSGYLESEAALVERGLKNPDETGVI